MDPSNYTLISFPFFGIEINPPRGFEIFGLDIRFYGVIIACGLLLALYYGTRRAKEFGLKGDDLMDGVLCVAPFAFLCARLFYCVFEWEQYADNPISVLFIWEGGLAIYGGVIGAVIGAAVFTWVKKLNLFAALDLVSMGFLIGQSMGRWGNFFNREAFGSATEGFLRMGLFNTVTDTWEYHHPTFLYESLWNAIGFVILHFWSRHRKYDGQIALGYAAWYGLGRCLIEGLRMDSLWWGPFRVNQLLAGACFLLGAAALIFLHFRPHDEKDLFVNKNRQEQ